MKKQLLLFVTMLLAVIMPMKLWAADGNPEPYAVLSDNDTKLTFFYDDQKDARGGLSVGPFSGYPDYQSWFNYRESIISVVFDTSFANCSTLSSTAYWFSGCMNLTSIEGIDNLKTDNVTSMYEMFDGCSSLTSLDVSGFKTDNVTNMTSMFSGCSSLTSLDVSGFKTNNVTRMSSMFNGCSGLTSLDLRGFKTASVTGMNGMFNGCGSLISLDLSGFNTANVTNIDAMFYGCSGLTSLDLGNFNTSNVSAMRLVFADCSNLKTIYTGEGWSVAKVDERSSGQMFMNCTNLVGGAGTVYDENHVDYTYAHIDGGTSNPGYFTEKDASSTAEPYAVLSDNETKLTFYYDDQKDARGGLSVGPFTETYDSGRERWKTDSGWDEKRENITTVVFDDSFANCTTLTSTAYWFYYCNNLTAISGISSLKTDNVTNMNSMFAGCSSLTSIDVTGFNTDKVTDMCNMFGICSSLTVLDVSRFNTSNVTDMRAMFYNCSSLTNLDVANFNTSKVTNMSYMFRSCSGLTGLDLTNFNTANVTEMSGMFYNCSGLTTLDVSGLNTANVTSMGGMFEDCSSLISLDVSHFKTANVTGMSYMFSGCSSLTNLDLSGFNTSNVASMSYMFMGCSGLTSLDISGFKTDNVYDMRSMFRDCSALTTIYAGDGWNTANVTEGGSMFYNCTNLVGGLGTRYSADHSSYTYAHIDGGTSNPGYFTAKNAAPVVDIVAKPTFALEGDNLAISTTTEGASIYYSVKEFITEPSGNGSLSSPYNVAAALQYINTLGADTPSPDSVCIRGVVTEISEISTTYGNATFYITDDGRTTSDRFLAYRVKNVGNVKFTTENAFQVGDEVIIRGIVHNYKGLTPETLQISAYIYAYTTPEMNMLYENPIALPDNVIVRAKATKQGMNDSEMAMFSAGCEPYAVLSENNTKLTFFYDNKKISNNGMGVGPFTVNYNTETKSYYVEGREWENHAGDIITVEFASSFANCRTITNMAGWFLGNTKLQTINGLEYLNTSNVTNMHAVFDDCSSLTSLDLSTFDTHKVTDMRGMFYGCTSLITLNVTSFNTSNVRLFNSMFNNCTALKSIDVSNFDTRNATSLRMMFRNCISLEALEIRNFETPNVTDMYHVFSGLRLPGIDLSKMNTEKVETMEGLFYKTAFSSLDLSGFNTSQVKNMYMMFTNSSNLQTIYVGDGWSTSNVTDGRNMFSNCNSLVGSAGTPYDSTCVDVTYAHIDGGENNPGYFTANNERVINGKFVTTDYSSFAYALEDNGTVIEITDNDIVDDTEEPGNRCIKIVSKDNATENWDSHFIIRIGEPLKEGQTYKFSMRAKVSRNVSISSQARTTPDQYLHYRMLGNFDLTTGWQTYNVEGVVESEQAGCTVIALLLNVDKSSAEYFFDDISFRVNEAPSASPEPYAVLSENDTVLTFYYDTEKDARGGMGVGPFEDLGSSGVSTEWFGSKSTITTVVFDDSFANCTTLTSTAYWFYQLTKLTTITGIQNLKMDNVNDINSMFCDCESLTSLNLSSLNLGNVTNMHQMFEGCTGLENIIFAGVNTENVTNMGDLFLNCRSLKTIDLSGFNTANVTNMSSMFERCFSLVSLDLSNFNTENVTNMHSMFDSCSRLASLNVSSFNTANVTDMGLMFSACYELTNLDVSHFNTENVTDIHGMFGGSSRLTSLDLSHFNTDKVTTMTYMFEGCSGLTSLDLSSFNTENVTKFSNMFKDCSNLKTIYVGNDWNTSKAEEGAGMFLNCTSLVGGAGTIFDANHVDYTYAHIDGGTSNPGYFTAKNAPEGEATFDGKVARVSGERTLDEAFEQRGGRAEATRTIAAIIWNKESALTESDLQGITNPNLLVYVNEARLAPSNVQNVVINGLAREIVLTDVQDGNNDWYAPQAFVAERISYTRNFTQSTTKGTSRGWESIALPFDVQTIQHESKGVIAPFNNSASNKHFWLRRLIDNGLQAATNIEANTPYIISMPNSEEYTSDYNLNGRVTFSAQNIDVPATTTKVLALADSSIVMVPAMQRQSRSSSVWALNVGEVRGQYFEGSVFERDYRTVRPFEAYTIHRQENGQPAPRYVPIQEIAGVTGIETIDREPLTLNQWYDMQGRKLEGKPARKGVYISNGKKVVVK